MRQAMHRHGYQVAWWPDQHCLEPTCAAQSTWRNAEDARMTEDGERLLLEFELQFSFMSDDCL